MAKLNVRKWIHTGALIASGFLLLLPYQNCGIEQPGVKGQQQLALATFHSVVTACMECHGPGASEDRWTAASGISAHSSMTAGPQECSGCHRFGPTKDDWKKLAIYGHEATTTSCISCHETQRPQQRGLYVYGTGSLGDRNLTGETSHYGTIDCARCHQMPGGRVTGWQFDAASHRIGKGATNIQGCLPCHYNRGYSYHASEESDGLPAFGAPYYSNQGGRLNTSGITQPGMGRCTQCHSGKSFEADD